MSAFIEETTNRLLPQIALIACGSFSPPTPMHFRMFEIARDHFEMHGTHKVIGGIVSPTHDAYGKKGLAPSKHRLSMVKLALQSSSWVRVSDWETKQDAWSRTQCVLQYHQNFMNNFINSQDFDNMNGDINQMPTWLPAGLRDRRDPVQLKLLCGADLLESFAVPGLWAEEDIENILANHGIVVISRAGSNPEKFIFDSDILTKHQRNITLVTNWVSNEVSSTMIRRLLCRGQSVKYLIDDLVLNYIKQNALFDSNTKYITSFAIKRHTNQPKNIVNISFINREREQMQISSNENTPSDEEADDDDDDDANDDEEEEMDETDYSVAKLNSKYILDNRKSNVFCCADANSASPNNGSGAIEGGIIKRLFGQPKKKSIGPGQAVQIIKTEQGITEVFDVEEMKSKKLKMAQNV